eukprot:TRINITY_DN6915_c0_g2_i1.p1 TRINITY_DN6915_c0_g2~~TRINITY_DN6915_c0_g2_i1.p1  ORF type:complete len:508 (-),score=44.64 TRINITY_DN6915_c0_g2_i1:312-1835(-)
MYNHGKEILPQEKKLGPSRKHKPLAPGTEFIKNYFGRSTVSVDTGRNVAFLLTFFAYLFYHASRKAPSIVKSVLHGDETLSVEQGEQSEPDNPGWEPFNGPNGKERLGQIDVAFLACYAIGMFTLGHLGDRYELRKWLAAGLLMSGIFVILVGMGYVWEQHTISYYVLTSSFAGFCQSTGWPTVVAIMANWFGHGKRGFVMGIWNSHTSMGNMLGSIIAAQMLPFGWGWAFIVPGVTLLIMSLVVFFFLIATPNDIAENTVEANSLISSSGTNLQQLAPSQNAHEVGMLQALAIPGVAIFAVCLFFAKLIAYTFLYWLPFYIGATRIGGEYLSPEAAGNLSVVFDIGGVIGGVVAGSLSDKYEASALVAFVFLMAALPCMQIYNMYGTISVLTNMLLMATCGFCVNGPYALITTAVSADLGSHESLAGNERALATVTAIIDGMGSVGAAIGPLITGYISEMPGGFTNVFIMLFFSALAAGMLLIKLVWKDIKRLRKLSYQARGNVQE